MRNATRNAVTVVGLGVLGVSYSIGAAAQTSGTFNSTTIGINGSNATAAAQAAAGADAGNINPVTTDNGSASSTTANGSTKASGGKTTNSSGSGSSSSSGSTSNSGSSTGSGTGSGSSSSATSAPVSTTPPAPVATPVPTKTTAPVVAVTKTGATINYRFGVIQVSVTKENGKITSVNLVQGTATHGRESAFPYLQQFAVQAQGSGFANMSGATYTADAFKQAVDSALSKF